MRIKLKMISLISFALCSVEIKGWKCFSHHDDLSLCCTPDKPCVEGEGECESDDECGGDLVCGKNCKRLGEFYPDKGNCCEKLQRTIPLTTDQYRIQGDDNQSPPEGQRCIGRNFQKRRCCTPENPCDEGEGDCDLPGDGGEHDGDEGCKGDLVCGSNNCRKGLVKFTGVYNKIANEDALDRYRLGWASGETDIILGVVTDTFNFTWVPEDDVLSKVRFPAFFSNFKSDSEADGRAKYFMRFDNIIHRRIGDILYEAADWIVDEFDRGSYFNAAEDGKVIWDMATT